jgi:hypothetical protein
VAVAVLTVGLKATRAVNIKARQINRKWLIDEEPSAVSWAKLGFYGLFIQIAFAQQTTCL